MEYRIIEVLANELLCENIEDEKKLYLSRHNFYTKDLDKIEVGKIIQVNTISIDNKMKSKYIVVGIE